MKRRKHGDASPPLQGSAAPSPSPLTAGTVLVDRRAPTRALAMAEASAIGHCGIEIAGWLRDTLGSGEAWIGLDSRHSLRLSIAADGLTVTLFRGEVAALYDAGIPMRARARRFDGEPRRHVRKLALTRGHQLALALRRLGAAEFSVEIDADRGLHFLIGQWALQAAMVTETVEPDVLFDSALSGILTKGEGPAAGPGLGGIGSLQHSTMQQTCTTRMIA